MVLLFIKILLKIFINVFIFVLLFKYNGLGCESKIILFRYKMLISEFDEGYIF